MATAVELDITAVTYEEAAMQLDVSKETIKQAIVRKVLTPLPKEGRLRYLMRGQVELFRGKRLSLSSLRGDDRKLWEKYREHATDTSSTRIDLRGVVYSPDFADRIAKTAVKEAVQAYQRGEVPQGVPFFDILREVFARVGKSLYLMFLLSMYLNGTLTEDDIREALDTMPRGAREQALETISHDEAFKPLRDLVRK